MLILAQSYPHVKNVLYLIDRYISDTNNIKLLVFKNEQLYFFFKRINSEHFNKAVDIYFIPGYSSKFNFILFRYNIILEKISLISHFNKSCNNLSNQNIYFFSKSFTDYGYYFLKRLWKKNIIFHIKDPACDIYTIRDGHPKTIKDFIQLLYAKLLLGRHIVFGDTGRKNFQNFFKISEKFYGKIVRKTFLTKERNRIQSNFKFSKFSIKNYNDFKVLYFDKDVVKDRLCDDKIFQKEIEAIFGVITEFFSSDEIGKKYKPNRTTDYNKNRLKVGKIIPDYIPAELLYNNCVNIYFGITSIALANIKKGNIISLAYLITFNNPEMREGSVNNQESRKISKKIYYPKTLNELRNLIIKSL